MEMRDKPGRDMAKVDGTEFAVGWSTTVVPTDERGPDGKAIWRHAVSWSAELPHQCDEFVVAGGYTREEAIAELRKFIADAHKALDALENFGS